MSHIVRHSCITGLLGGLLLCAPAWGCSRTAAMEKERVDALRQRSDIQVEGIVSSIETRANLPPQGRVIRLKNSHGQQPKQAIQIDPTTLELLDLRQSNPCERNLGDKAKPGDKVWVWAQTTDMGYLVLDGGKIYPTSKPSAPASGLPSTPLGP